MNARSATAAGRALLLPNLGVALLYAGGGLAGSLLALPPGYASAFWLPAGIALLAVLVRGRRLWPGILLGSFLVNLYISAKASGFQGPLAPFVPLALGIGAGAAVQAVVGGHLVRRFVGYPTALLRHREILLCLGLGGPVSCLISASTGVSLLVLTGVIPGANVPFAWFSWFAGDTLGVLIMVPLFLVFFGEPASSWRARRVQVALPILVSTAGVLAGFAFADHQETVRVRAAFLARATEVDRHLQAALDDRLGLLALVRAQVAAGTDPGAAGLVADAGGILAGPRGFTVVRWLPATPSGAVPGLPPDCAQGAGTAGDRAPRVAYGAAEPASGWDVAVFLPVFRDPGAGGALRGFLMGGLRAGDLVEQAVEGQDLARIRFQVSAEGPRGTFFVRPFQGEGTRDRTLAPFRYQGTLVLAGERWRVSFEPSLGFLDANRSPLPWLVQCTGLLITALFGWFMLILSVRSERMALGEARLAKAEAQSQLEGIINAATEYSIIATDPEGVIQVFSPGAERLLGYGAHELVGLATPARLHLESEVRARGEVLSVERGRPVEGFAVFVERCREGEAEGLEWTYVRKDGSTVPVLLVVTPIRDRDGRTTGFLGIAKDISREKQAQEALVQAREQADLANRMKGEFVANMSHEIRTPMHAVLGLARLLRATPLSQDQRRYLDLIQASSRSLLGILNDVLDFSKMEAGRLEVVREPCRLDEILRALGPILSVNAGEKDLEVIIGVDPGVPGAFLGDALRLQQVLVNLAGNAVKFTPKGELAVWVRCTVRDGDRATLQFQVRDTGIGMTPAQQEKVFSAFWQAETSLTRRFEGTGLGLVIARRLVELMGGTLDLESAAGEGTTFRCTLPVQVLPEAGPDRFRPAALRILVVDDNASSREAIALCIRSWGWEPVTVASGEAALARLAEDPGFDAVLVDWSMPGLGGPATLAAMAALERGPCPPALLLTRLGEGHGSGGPLPPAPILPKPVTSSSLFDAISELLGRDHPEALASGAPGDGPSLAGVNVLLVEDNLTNQIVAGEFLEAAGAEVDLAGNGLEALQALEAHPGRYHLVLMDVQMPVLDGFSASRTIRERGLGLPVIAMTAGVLPEDRAACLEAGMVDFVPKPVDLDALLQVIVRHLPFLAREG